MLCRKASDSWVCAANALTKPPPIQPFSQFFIPPPSFSKILRVFPRFSKILQDSPPLITTFITMIFNHFYTMLCRKASDSWVCAANVPPIQPFSQLFIPPSKFFQDSPSFSKLFQDSPSFSKILRVFPRFSKILQDSPSFSPSSQHHFFNPNFVQIPIPHTQLRNFVKFECDLNYFTDC